MKLINSRKRERERERVNNNKSHFQIPFSINSEKRSKRRNLLSRYNQESDNNID